MKIIDEIMPKIRAEARLDKDNKTLWVKADTLDGYGRVIIEDGSNWCRIFYEDCGECAHNKAEQTEPQTDGIIFKGNLKEGDYKLIKTTDGWVLEGENIVYCGSDYRL